ncbi:MAG: hypothetical protein Ct9H90mP22_8660 [Gammaproteobacteria bacterium]|nr:MAG: hypothetical protein Ct9H90mP22_8660 [Gammaproteobacteria bacterium]
MLLEPQKIDPDEFENIKGSLKKTHLQGGRLPGFDGKAFFLKLLVYVGLV